LDQAIANCQKVRRVSVVQAATAAGGLDVLLLESPEPIAWDGITLSAIKAGAIPQRNAYGSAWIDLVASKIYDDADFSI
jgi:hypothetical protein